MSPSRLAALALAVPAFLAASPSPAFAQNVLVEVTAAESGAPIPGAFVSLLDGGARALLSRLTDPSGRALLPVEGPGPFRVRAEMIGRETVTSEPFAGGAAERIGLALASRAIPLSEIRVEAEGRCDVRPEEASDLARVWEEARKPLAVQAWAEGEAAFRMRVSSYERDLDADGRRVERESRRGTSVVTRVPFASLPAETLVGEGFVRAHDDGGHEYFGPDAAVLLSDAFLDTHCFRLARSRERPGSIGLAFEPVEADERPDIRGTFWLDEATAALQVVEYRYTRPPYREAEGLAGGTIEFGGLPNGAWMIERWSIRAPLLGRSQRLARAGDPGIRVIGVRETGGEVLEISTMDRRPVSRVARGSVRGVVWDSVAARPLAGATVRLAGTGFQAESDAEGRFALDELPAGVFTATFEHPRLDSLGLELPGVEVEVVTGRTAEVALGVPSTATLMVAACESGGEGDAAAGDRPAAVLSGVVRARDGGAPVPGARVRVEWQEVERTEPTIQAKDRWLEVGADAEGRYTLCGLPVDEALRVHASLLSARSAAAEVAFAEAEHRSLDLEVELPVGAAAGAGRVSAEYAAGVQGVQGRLLEHESGRPVRAAEVALTSGSGAVLATATTNERGFFRLQVPAAGRFIFSARALGYAPIEAEAVEVQPEKLTVLDVQIAPAAIEMEPILVTAEARSFHLEMEGFYQRRDGGFGTHITPEALERRMPRQASDMLYGVSGANVVESMGPGGRAVYFRSGSRFTAGSSAIMTEADACWPMVYVDRRLVSAGGFATFGGEATAVDDAVPAADIFAMEVYDSPAEIPSEFNGPNAGCGVVVIWTRRGGGG